MLLTKLIVDYNNKWSRKYAFFKKLILTFTIFTINTRFFVLNLSQYDCTKRILCIKCTVGITKVPIFRSCFYSDNITRERKLESIAFNICQYYSLSCVNQ